MAEAMKFYCVEDKIVDGHTRFIKGRVYEYETDHLIPLVERPAKVGEWVYITNRKADSDHTYANGDVCQVLKEHAYGSFIKTLTGRTHGANIGTGTAYIWHSEYLVLDGYKPEEEVKKEKPFEPYLFHPSNNKHYGVVGKPTLYKDAVGRPLFVGDVVETVDRDDGASYGNHYVVEDSTDGQFVMGICCACDAKTGGIALGWKVLRVRKYSELEAGEAHSGIKYISNRDAEPEVKKGAVPKPDAADTGLFKSLFDVMEFLF